MLFDVGSPDHMDSYFDYESVNEDNLSSYIEEEQQNLNIEDLCDHYLKGSSRALKNRLSTKINRHETEQRLSILGFEAEIYDLNHRGESQQAMYLVHKQFIEWKRGKDLTACDIFLRNLDIEILDIRILISLLMASFQIKSRLSYRSFFCEKVMNKAAISFSEEELNQIFSGLK